MHARSARDGLIRCRRLSGILNVAAVLALGSGLLCLSLYGFAEADQRMASAAAVTAFHEARDGALARTPDQALWSANRRVAYDEARLFDVGTPAALLRIPSVDLLVPIFKGTGALVLNRGIGWIEGTTPPGDDGNIGLAGHRDGFFRRLKDIRIGDSLEIQTVDAARRYRVTGTFIVAPTDVYVLDPTEEPSVTLVTCYPFYFVGAAPQRFVVRGVLDGSSVRVSPIQRGAVRQDQ